MPLTRLLTTIPRRTAITPAPHDPERRPIPPGAWQLDAASLSDADKTLRVLPPRLRPYAPGQRMLGRAVVVRAYGDLNPVLAGLERCGPGDVLVVDGGEAELAVLGELFATEALRRGLAGIVVSGYCRDTATLVQLPLPVYAVGTTPRAGGAARLPTVEESVSIGDVEVRLGDILLGDDDGIVVLDDAELAAALPAAEAIQWREETVRRAIPAGTSLFDQLNFAEHVELLRAGQPSALKFRA